MIIDEYTSKDPRKFFSPLFDYALSEFIGDTEKKLEDMGYSYVFLSEIKSDKPKDKEAKEIADKLGLQEFPNEAYARMKDKTVIVGYGLLTLAEIAKEKGLLVKHKNFHHVVSKVDAGTVPVVHSHLLFRGSPHPLVDEIAFRKINDLGGFKPTIEDVERSLYDYELRFKQVFSDWSLLVKDLKAAADLVEARLDSEKGAREFYALSLLMGGELDLAVLWNRVGRVMELPRVPNLDVLILG